MLALRRGAFVSRTATRVLSAKFSTVDGINNMTVLGSGLMGNGIAQVSAAAGYNVTVYDLNDSLLEKATATIQKNMTRVAMKKLNDEAKAKEQVDGVMSKISTSTDLEAAVSKADLVIEVVVENEEIKQTVFRKVDDAAPAHCLLATNTSGLSVTSIMSRVSEERKKLVGGLHFFNPVPMMKLLEVVRIDSTSDETFAKFNAFGESVGKTTVSCIDTPGFIVNRLLIPYLAEAMQMVERGDASIEDVDVAMKLGCGYPMGPFQLADYVGLDTCQFVISSWHSRFPNEPRFNPVASLDKLVSEGKLGIKSGQGFYSYNKK